MKSAAMTSCERWLAALSLEPVDRLPFWPKIFGGYERTQTAPFNAMSIDALHKYIGSDRHVWIAGGLRETRRGTAVESQDSPGAHITIYHTSSGDLRSEIRYDDPSASWHPVEFPVKTPDDIARMTEVFDDVAVEPDDEGLATACEQRADAGDALTVATLGTSPLMEWVESLAGVENAHYFLADHAEDVEALFSAMMRPLLRRAEILADRSPADVIYLIENTSTTLISPDQFRRHCVPHIRAVGETVAAADGPTLMLHMCGKLHALLGDIADLPAAGIESFTAPPLGDTTLADGRAQCPDKCLVGGTHAMLWTRPAKEIIAHVELSLDALPHHRGIVVTSAGVMPPLAAPDTVKAVCDWVKTYPVRN